MTLQLYLDDCLFSHRLRAALISAGHMVVIPADVALRGARDEDHAAFAKAQGLVLITTNPDDFIALYEPEADHPGLLIVYQDNSRRKDMTPEELCRAIENILDSGVGVTGQIHFLNHWRF